MSASPEPLERNSLPPYSSRFVEGSELSDLANIRPGQSAFSRRPGYERVDSNNPFGDDAAYHDTFVSPPTSAHGLGIAGHDYLSNANIAARRQNSVPPVGIEQDMFSPRETIGASSNSTTPAFTPGLSRPFLSPNSRSPEFDYMGYQGKDIGDAEYGKSGMHRSTPSGSTLRSQFEAYRTIDDTDRMADTRSIKSTRSAYQTAFNPTKECHAKHDLHQGCGNWLSITIYMLSAFSTVLSGLFFVCAVIGPFWPRIRAVGGDLTPQSSIILTSVLAKTVELSFVTAFVACLGQIISRRAFNHDEGKGMTLAEMSMRNWIMQPGTMITHPASVRYGAVSILGVVAILATIMSTLYTSAAAALVQPQLKLTGWHPKTMQGQVMTQWANVTHLSAKCETPIDFDSGYNGLDGKAVAGATCVQLEYSAQSFHNYVQYLAAWTERRKKPNNDGKRPKGIALYQNNIQVEAPWLESRSIETTTEQYGFPVQEVTLAMPHAGVVQAAKFRNNNILQPSDLEGQGLYYIHASVPSLAMNVVCATVDEDALSPLIYRSQPGANQTDEELRLNYPAKLATEVRGPTKLDDLFGWEDLEIEYNDLGNITGSNIKNARPIFPKFPLQHNSLLNHTKDGRLYGRDRLYLLLRAPDYVTDNQTMYNICSMKPHLTDECSTIFNSTSETAGALIANCDKNNTMAFKNGALNNTIQANPMVGSEWFPIGSEWGNSLSLNHGTFDGNGSNSRILSQLALKEGKLNPDLPSVAEALAVMASSTLLMSMQDVTFYGYWAYPIDEVNKPDLSNATGTPAIEEFAALINEQQYASGVHTTDGKGFMIVLFTVFVINILVAIYFIFHWGFITDYSEPPNMFTIAINSPPSHLLSGACGTGPEYKQWDVQWFLNHENDHMFLQAGDQKMKGGFRRRHRPGSYMPHANTPVSQFFEKFGKKKSWV